MKTALYQYHNETWNLHPKCKPLNDKAVQLVLCFAGRNMLTELPLYSLLKEKFPAAVLVLCSTSGEIFHTAVTDEGVSVAAIEFTSSYVVPQQVFVRDYSNSFEAGEALIKQFDQKDLSYVLVLSDGSEVNGSELVRGLNAAASNRFLVTGGLAGDGDRFESTLVGLNSDPQPGLIVGVGFYGDKLKVRHGSQGGWETFGLEKLVTKSKDNILFEIDGLSALSRYKRYLGPDADGLPGTALLYPLSVRLTNDSEPIVRTILSVNEQEGSMTFAGDIPLGSKVRFMRANFDKLTSAASIAATQTKDGDLQNPDFALLISCVGRKMILSSRSEDEVDAVDEIFNSQTLLSGFYSYGEISPLIKGQGCQLHNQTMTITTFTEDE